MAEVTVLLRDINEGMVAEWRQAFADAPNVEISCGNILELTADAIVSPANSFGYMDGGIDLAYSQYFGWELQERLKRLLAREYFGELPVGQAVVVPTEHKSIRWLVSAPTMRVPSSISRTVNVYLAFRAALMALLKHNVQADASISSILVPGLGTGVGEMPFARAARQMRAAYDAIILGRGTKERNAGRIWGEHDDLLA